MYIKNIELKNFRNYSFLQSDFSRNVNLILGNNAQGKTNLLESIYVTSIGRSFRTSKDSNLVKFDENFAKIKVEAEKADFDTNVEITIKKDSKKQIKKDGHFVKKTSDLLENIMIVIFSPEDLKIVKDEPEKRRKFIDRELCQIKPLYYENFYNYRKTLLQRNALLKEETVDTSLLDLWDYQISGYGAAIIQMRDSFVRKISGYSSEIHKNITNGKEKLEIRYNPNIGLCENMELQREKLYSEIKDSFENDMRQRTTTKGPHKDDISFFVNDINMRNFGSQGQQRTCALSLKLAELSLVKEETGEDAILLLDDVMSELDRERQKFLVKTLSDNQLFITTTDVEREFLDNFPDAKVIYIDHGNIIEK